MLNVLLAKASTLGRVELCCLDHFLLGGDLEGREKYARDVTWV